MLYQTSSAVSVMSWVGISIRPPRTPALSTHRMLAIYYTTHDAIKETYAAAISIFLPFTDRHDHNAPPNIDIAPIATPT